MLEKGRKTTRKKSAAPKGAAAQPTPASAVEKPGRGALSQEERRRMIAESAYYRAQRRGFHAGDPNRDWIEAEAEIDAMLLQRR